MFSSNVGSKPSSESLHPPLALRALDRSARRLSCFTMHLWGFRAFRSRRWRELHGCSLLASHPPQQHWLLRHASGFSDKVLRRSSYFILFGGFRTFGYPFGGGGGGRRGLKGGFKGIICIWGIKGAPPNFGHTHVGSSASALGPSWSCRKPSAHAVKARMVPSFGRLLRSGRGGGPEESLHASCWQNTKCHIPRLP